MTQLVAGCKINLGLRILAKRSDGYHELESLFYPLDTPQDILEVTEVSTPGLIMTTDSPHVDPKHNTLQRTYQIFREQLVYKPNVPALPGLQLKLVKGIPVGAGLGGGSSDAAVFLQYLNKKLDNPFNLFELWQMAQRIGADVPFFLRNEPCQVSGIGEIINPIKYNLAKYFIVLVCPDLQIATKWAYDQYDRLTKKDLESNKRLSGKMINDLEAAVFPFYPQLQKIKTELLLLKAEYACMTGSGSCIFGIFMKSAMSNNEVIVNCLQDYGRIFITG